MKMENMEQQYEGSMFKLWGGRDKMKLFSFMFEVWAGNLSANF